MKRQEIDKKTFADFCKKLALLLRTGLLVSDALHLIATEETDKDIRSIAEEMSQKTLDGSVLADCFEETECFSSYANGMIRIGERIGRTEETLFALSAYYEKTDRFHRQIRASLVYPTFMLVMILAVIGVILTQVLPIFNDVYVSLGGSLTGVAGGLLFIGNNLRESLPLIGICAAVLLILAAIVLLIPSLYGFLTKTIRRIFGNLGIAKKINRAHFAQALALALNSGMPIEDGIELARSMLSDTPAAAVKCDNCLKLLAEGEDIVSAFKATDLMPESSCNMLKIGLRSGNADTIMHDIADRLQEEAEDALAARTAVIEPMMVLFTSLLIGVILLAVMLPLVDIMKVF